MWRSRLLQLTGGVIRVAEKSQEVVQVTERNQEVTEKNQEVTEESQHATEKNQEIAENERHTRTIIETTLVAPHGAVPAVIDTHTDTAILVIITITSTCLFHISF